MGRFETGSEERIIMPSLSVNIDHIATLREARKVAYPDPVAAAVLAELAGAEGIVVHLREDRRHIQDRDVRLLRETVQTKLILEMAATSEMIDIAMEIMPDLVTLVPEKREELTTEGGLDLISQQNNAGEAVAVLRQAGIPTSIFVNPDPEQIKLAHQINAAKVEIHTGTFCDAVTPEKRRPGVFDDRRVRQIGQSAETGSPCRPWLVLFHYFGIPGPSRN